MSEKNISRQANLIEIDGAKLNAEIEKRGITKVEASEELGYSRNFVNHLITCERARPIVLKMLESLYGISYDDIKPDEEPVEAPVEDVEPEAPGQMEMTFPDDFERMLVRAFADALRMVVYPEVKRAFIDALHE